MKDDRWTLGISKVESLDWTLVIGSTVKSKFAVALLLILTLSVASCSGRSSLRAVANTIDDGLANAKINPNISNLKVEKDVNNGTIKISFTFKGNVMGLSQQTHTGYGLLVRLFDKNGSYLTHFTTEALEYDPKERQAYWDEIKSPSDKHFSLAYNVPARDLEAADMAEVGFWTRSFPNQ
jgi:hypothetical protein